jgi:hypothetical protein
MRKKQAPPTKPEFRLVDIDATRERRARERAEYETAQIKDATDLERMIKLRNELFEANQRHAAGAAALHETRKLLEQAIVRAEKAERRNTQIVRVVEATYAVIKE